MGHRDPYAIAENALKSCPFKPGLPPRAVKQGFFPDRGAFSFARRQTSTDCAMPGTLYLRIVRQRGIINCKTGGRIFPASSGYTYSGIALKVSKDWVWDHSSRKAPHLPVIRMSDGVLRYRTQRNRRVRQRARTSVVLASQAPVKWTQPARFPHRNRRTDGQIAPGRVGRPAGKPLVRVFPQTSH